MLRQLGRHVHEMDGWTDRTQRNTFLIDLCGRCRRLRRLPFRKMFVGIVFSARKYFCVTSIHSIRVTNHETTFQYWQRNYRFGANSCMRSIQCAHTAHTQSRAQMELIGKKAMWGGRARARASPIRWRHQIWSNSMKNHNSHARTHSFGALVLFSLVSVVTAIHSGQ